ncbi:hypothetical protein EBR43_08805 [bacterium]|jgi:hypothetical protein|nr:hypothetical protein [bacterium]NBX71320.1 hypothetical protein [bacterium]
MKQINDLLLNVIVGGEAECMTAEIAAQEELVDAEFVILPHPHPRPRPMPFPLDPAFELAVEAEIAAE